MPQTGFSWEHFATTSVPQVTLPQMILQLQNAPENKVCYAIRSYDFARDGADLDATRLTGSSTCRPSSQLKLKSAVRIKVAR